MDASTEVRSSAPPSNADVNAPSRSIFEACGTTVSKTACLRNSPGTSRPGITMRPVACPYRYDRSSTGDYSQPNQETEELESKRGGLGLGCYLRVDPPACGGDRGLSGGAWCKHNKHPWHKDSSSCGSFFFVRALSVFYSHQHPSLIPTKLAFMNSMSGPAGVPAIWQEARNSDGRVYYYNVQTKATQWTKPFELMSPVEVGFFFFILVWIVLIYFPRGRCRISHGKSTRPKVGGSTGITRNRSKAPGKCQRFTRLLWRRFQLLKRQLLRKCYEFQWTGA